MEDFNNSEKSPEDFLKLSDLCISICEDKEVKLGDWSQRDIDLFVSQFQQAEVEPEIDMTMLDPKALPRSYFEKKFPLFDDFVIDAIYELENKKLEDTRLCPLRRLDKVGTLEISNPNKIYNATKESNQTQGQEETKGKEDGATETETSSEADDICCGSDRFRWFKKANEEEEDDP